MPSLRKQFFPGKMSLVGAALRFPLRILWCARMVLAIAIGAGAFGVIDALMDPTLPLDDGLPA